MKLAAMWISDLAVNFMIDGAEAGRERRGG